MARTKVSRKDKFSTPEAKAAIKRRRILHILRQPTSLRGWPETDNTWEPLVKLQSCSDVIEAFEASLQSRKWKSGRKRKRKHGFTLQPQSKKKPQQHQRQQQCSPAAATYDVPAVRVTLNEDHLPFAPLIDSLNALEADVGAVNSGETVKQEDENGAGVVFPRDDGRKEMDLSSRKLSVPKGSRFVNLDNPGDVSVHVQEQPAPESAAHTNGVPSVDGRWE